MAAIFIRTVIVYIMLIVVMRFMGKRQIGQLQLSELITALLLSQVASQPITNANIPLIYAVIPIVMLISLEIFVSFISTKSAVLKSILDGKPSIIIDHGTLNQKELLKLRLSIDELLCELRLKNIASPDEVQYAILEQNGQISVFPKDANKNVTLGDMYISGSGKGISHAVIVDGHVIDYALNLSQKNRAWLDGQIKNSGIGDIKEIFLMTVDDTGSVQIIKKERG